MNDFNTEITRVLRDYMQEHGVTQEKVAEHLNRSQNYVSGRLKGRLDLSVDILGAVAELTGTDPRALNMELSARMLTTNIGHGLSAVEASE